MIEIKVETAAPEGRLTTINAPTHACLSLTARDQRRRRWRALGQWKRYNLYERMRALGLSKADVEAAAQGVLRDLQRTCACCNEKSICERNLAQRPEAPVWMSYCPNAVTLEVLAKLKAHASV